MLDADRGQIVQAHLALNEGLIPDDNRIKRFQDDAEGWIAPYKYPRSARFVDALPRTATGKVQRLRLKDTNTLQNEEEWARIGHSRMPARKQQ